MLEEAIQEILDKYGIEGTVDVESGVDGRDMLEVSIYAEPVEVVEMEYASHYLRYTYEGPKEPYQEILDTLIRW